MSPPKRLSEIWVFNVILSSQLNAGLLRTLSDEGFSSVYNTYDVAILLKGNDTNYVAGPLDDSIYRRTGLGPVDLI